MTAQVMERIERGKTHEGRGQRREEGVEGQDRGMERRAEERRGLASSGGETVPLYTVRLADGGMETDGFGGQGP